MFKARWMEGKANETLVWSITTIDIAPAMAASTSQFRRLDEIDTIRPSADLQLRDALVIVSAPGAGRSWLGFLP
jgi:hypothetical protein